MGIPIPEYRDLSELSQWVVDNLPSLAPEDAQLGSSLAVADSWLAKGNYSQASPLYRAQMNSTAGIKVQLVTLIHEMNVRPIGKNVRLKELAVWVTEELPSIAPDDPRTKRALVLAQAALIRTWHA
jgi:hypothetical protein